MTEMSMSRRKQVRQRHYPSEREDRLRHSGNPLADDEDGGFDLTDGRNERVRSLLTEAVTLLCKNSVFYKTELIIEGLLGVTVDTKDVFLVNINQKVNNHSSASDHARGHDEDEYNVNDVGSSRTRNMDQPSAAWVHSDENLSPPHPKRHKGKTKHQAAVPITQDSPQHNSTILFAECTGTMLDRQAADYRTDVQFDTTTSDVVIKSEPGCESSDYTENIYEDVGQQSYDRNNKRSIDSSREHTTGSSDVTRSNYHNITETPHSCSNSPSHPTNVCNWNFPVDTECDVDRDDSVTCLSHSENDRTFEPYIARSAIFPIITNLPSKLAKNEAGNEMTTVANSHIDRLSIQTPTQQSTTLPTGGTKMSYSPTSMLTPWGEMQQKPNGQCSDDGDHHNDESEGRMGLGNAFIEIRAMSTNSAAGSPEGQSTMCKICGKMLANRTVYSRHLKTHLGRYFTCQYCSRRFNRKDNLKRHYALIHQVPFNSSSTSNMDNEHTLGPTTV
ncbi:hypothetical protein LSAT2_020007 [Lamellibrachia satsuma]|nr:hypothetical protein LSAT2_020007 [Lamellibrachia satsuma]